MIKTSIMDGRNGVMPALGAALGNAEEVKDVVHHVMSLSGRTHDKSRAERGKPKFDTLCAACHGLDGKGNQAIGAPNLSDQIWLYGGSEEAITETITKGRGASQATEGASVMPAHKDKLGEAKVHLLAAYVWSLSNLSGGAAPPAK